MSRRIAELGIAAGILVGAAAPAAAASAVSFQPEKAEGPPQAARPNAETEAGAQTGAPEETGSPAAESTLFDDNRRAAREQRFTINGRLETELQDFNNFDLDDGERDDRVRITPEARLEFGYRPNKDMLAFLSFEIGRDVEDVEGRRSTGRSRLELREAFILWEDFVEDFELQIGRQDFEDSREWLFDERLDGVRLVYDENDWEVTLAVAREGLVRTDLLRRNSRRGTDNLLISAEREITDDLDAVGYYFRQQDRREGETRNFLGFQAEGEVGGGFDIWLDAAVLRGDDGRGKSLRGYALDAGVIYSLRAPGKPALILGYAHGSGGETSQVDRSFRQTGLQDNEDRLSGLSNVKYYGELLDPELSNLSIITAGIGFRPTEASSLELIWHKYKQVDASDDEIRDSPLLAEPAGDDRSLGFEVDAIAAFRLAAGVGLEVKLGYFRPGEAFTRQDDAKFAKARVVYRF
ncbi:MAG TPA: alginate export family protein [Chloroflexota bacterium]|nr:alginate export family protein [Chloroflexota bacterium]